MQAAIALSRLPRSPIKRIILALNSATGSNNRQAAAYALAWLYRKRSSEPLAALIRAAMNENETPAVRGQAFEGIGIHCSNKQSSLSPEVENAVLTGLANPVVEVRFWACYAAGMSRLRSALPRLHELARQDDGVYPRWWRVSEEAADAIEWIEGRGTEPRKLGAEK